MYGSTNSTPVREEDRLSPQKAASDWHWLVVYIVFGMTDNSLSLDAA